jgi:hypothetical protein
MMFLSNLEDGSSIFVDANIFIYHFCKKSKLNPASSNFLERAETSKISGVTSTNDSDFDRVNFITLYKPSVSTKSPE